MATIYFVAIGNKEKAATILGLQANQFRDWKFELVRHSFLQMHKLAYSYALFQWLSVLDLSSICHHHYSYSLIIGAKKEKRFLLIPFLVWCNAIILIIMMILMQKTDELLNFFDNFHFSCQKKCCVTYVQFYWIPFR